MPKHLDNGKNIASLKLLLLSLNYDLQTAIEAKTIRNFILYLVREKSTISGNPTKDWCSREE